MYEALLIAHSWLRWAVLIFGLVAIFLAYQGWGSNKPFGPTDNRFGTFFIGSLHLQLLIGLILYFFLSPVTQTALQNMGAAMRDRDLRFWAVEHLVGMVIAVVVAQIGRIKSRKAPTDLQKHKRAAIYFTIALILILISIPIVTRPWFRM
jgi:uncharacterized membrane protein